MDEFVFDEVCTQVHVFFTFMAQSLPIRFPITHKPARGTKCVNSYIFFPDTLSTHIDRYAHMHKNVQMNAEQNIQRIYKSTIMHKYIIHKNIENITLCPRIPIMVDIFLCYSSAVAVLKSKYVFIFQRKRWRISGHC